MTNLILACAFFLGLHLLVSGTALRGLLTRRLGEGPYLGLFSLASLGGVFWLATAYNEAAVSPDNIMLPGFPLPLWFAHLGGPVMLIAFLFVFTGLTTPNPTAVRSEKRLESAEPVRGILRVTRHPFLWGAMIWSVFHLLANGELAATLLFGTFLLLTALGTRSIDAKRRKALGGKWDAFAVRTSNVPFAAVLAGRQSLKLGEIAWWQWLGGVAAFAALLWLHADIFGVAPIPHSSP